MIISQSTTITNTATSILPEGADPITADKEKQSQRFSDLVAATIDAEATLADITKGGAKGYWDWKIKELRKQLKEQIMTEMNLTPEKLAQMSAKERVETENKLSDMVEARLKLAINEEMKRKQRAQLHITTAPQAVLASQDITITS